MAQQTLVTFVVMAGGRGERLWPFVRAAQPKVCLLLDGRRTLLQATIDRLRPVWPGARWLVVTTQEQAVPVRAALPPALRRSLLVEPQVKNTAACITLAAVALAARDPHQVMVVVPADHWIGEPEIFQRCVRTAIRAAVAYDTVATIGVPPTFPHTGLGYLCGGSRLSEYRQPPVYRLIRSIEKPTEARARELLRRPRTFWNSGAFVATADKFLECVTEWLPGHTRHLVPLARTVRSASLSQRARAAYRALDAVSFDHGVMDHVHGGLVVEGRFAWADLGSLDVWARLGPQQARAITLDGERITVVSQGPHLVATIGLRNLLVAHTPTATLVCPPQRAQEVRGIIRRLMADPRLAAWR